MGTTKRFAVLMTLVIFLILNGSCGDSHVRSSTLGGKKLRTSSFITRNEDRLKLNQRDYLFTGANQYYFFYKNRRMIDDVFDSAQKLGLTTIRTWAFCEGSLHDGFCFQPSPGEYDEATFRNLDYAIYKASKTGIKLILTLANNWGGRDHFGGVDQYLLWVDKELKHDDFFSNKAVKNLYKNYINYVLNRVNTLSGTAYKDDPAILIWELMNEPRADDKEALYSWIDEMAGYIKSIDPNHLVSTGSEGGYASDFYLTHNSKNIDIASLHLYPDWWNMTVAESDEYIKEHIRIARENLKKPLYLGEFGFKDKTQRAEVYKKWYEIMHQGEINGTLFWLLSGNQYGDPRNDGTRYPDYDGFTIYYPESIKECKIIADYSQKVAIRQVIPQIKITSPESTLASNGQIFITANILGSDTAINHAEYRIDAGEWSDLSAEKNHNYTALFDSLEIRDGLHNLEVRAFDLKERVGLAKIAFYSANSPKKATLHIDPRDSKIAPDFGEIYIADDANFFYILIHRYDKLPSTFSSNNYLYVDIDNNPLTGEFGFDHRINFRSVSDHVQGHGDTFEWYYWNQTHWAYGNYFQASDNPKMVSGNLNKQVLPTGTVVAGQKGMFELAVPKTPKLGLSGAQSTHLRLWINGESDQVGTAQNPIVHRNTQNQTVIIDGKITTPLEWH